MRDALIRLFVDVDDSQENGLYVFIASQSLSSIAMFCRISSSD